MNRMGVVMKGGVFISCDVFFVASMGKDFQFAAWAFVLVLVHAKKKRPQLLGGREQVVAKSERGWRHGTRGRPNTAMMHGR